MPTVEQLNVTITGEKRCAICKQWKLATEFHPRQGRCKPCHRGQMKKNYHDYRKGAPTEDDKCRPSSAALRALRLR